MARAAAPGSAARLLHLVVFMLVLANQPASGRPLPRPTGGCEKSRSQSGEEDAAIKRFFANTTRGTYVEIGAYDGVTFSNTLALHTCLNWTGILIEASAVNVAKLKRNAKLFRPSATPTVKRAGVCARPQTVIKFAALFTVGGDVGRMSNAFKKDFHKKHLGADGDWVGGGTELVPCYPMKELVGELNHIDFFSLDIEGAELEALLTLDFSKLTVDVFVIEMDKYDEANNNRIAQLMSNLGYTMCSGTEHWKPRSGLFVHARRQDYLRRC